MSHPFWAPAKLFLGTIVFNVVDYWVWPQFHEEFTTQVVEVNNITLDVAITEQVGDANIKLHSNQFWQHFELDPCFIEGGCNWTSMLCVYFSLMVLNICGCAYMGHTPRFATIYTPCLSNITCLFHEFVVRGRYLAPSSTHIYSVFAGSVTGVLTWGCLNFTCMDEPNRHHPAAP